MFSLNIYWYSLVVKGLKKLMEANGCLKPSKKEVKDVKGDKGTELVEPLINDGPNE